MSDGHRISGGRNKMLFFKSAVVGLVAAISINTYCCFIEKGEKFSTGAAQEGRGSSSWKYFGGFLCADIVESLFLHKHGFLLQHLEALPVAAANTRTTFYLLHYVCAITPGIDN